MAFSPGHPKCDKIPESLQFQVFIFFYTEFNFIFFESEVFSCRKDFNGRNDRGMWKIRKEGSKGVSKEGRKEQGNKGKGKRRRRSECKT